MKFYLSIDTDSYLKSRKSLEEYLADAEWTFFTEKQEAIDSFEEDEKYHYLVEIEVTNVLTQKVVEPELVELK